MTSKQIDYVFPYVTMDDKVWQKSYEKHIGGTINKCRYRDNGLLRYKIAGLKKYMPWARIVMLVSSESQVPSWIDRKEVKIVTHDKFIPKEFLPTFSSCTIEMFLHNIPDLSEYFIYSNDDFYITSPMKLTDFVTTKAKLLFNTISNPSKTLFNSTMRNQWDFIARKYNRPLTMPEVRPAHIDSVMQKSFNKKIYDKWKNEIHQHIFKTRSINAFNQYFWLLCMYLENNYIQSTVSYMYANMTSAISADKMSKYNIVALNDNSKVTDEDISKVKIVLEDFYFPKPHKVIQKPVIAKQTPIIEGNKSTQTIMPVVKDSGTRVALCAIAKGENKYIREWVEYYRHIGVDRIFIADNNDTEKFEDVINDYITSGFVRLYNYRNLQASQNAVYKRIYDENYKSFDYMMFFDIDEFLNLGIYKSVKEYLSLPKLKNADVIMINWKIFGDSDNISYENKDVRLRFTTPAVNIPDEKEFSLYNRTNYQVKSICACRKPMKECFTHKMTFDNGIYVDSDGNCINRVDAPSRWAIDHVCTNVVLNHYLTKTAEEFALRQRGRALKFMRAYSVNEIIQNFFIFNKYTKEKELIIRNVLNEHNKASQA